MLRSFGRAGARWSPGYDERVIVTLQTPIGAKEAAYSEEDSAQIH